MLLPNLVQIAKVPLRILAWKGLTGLWMFWMNVSKHTKFEECDWIQNSKSSTWCDLPMIKSASSSSWTSLHGEIPLSQRIYRLKRSLKLWALQTLHINVYWCFSAIDQFVNRTFSLGHDFTDFENCLSIPHTYTNYHAGKMEVYMARLNRSRWNSSWPQDRSLTFYGCVAPVLHFTHLQ